MSYNIIYDKQFIRVDDYYIPIVLIGSSNLFEAETKARVRDWWIWQFVDNKNTQFLYTEKELLDYADKTIQRVIDTTNDRHRDNPVPVKEIKESFDSYSSVFSSNGGMTAGKFYGIFKNGIKRALTIEQLQKGGLDFQFVVYISEEEQRIRSLMPAVTTNTTQELKHSLKSFETFLNNNKEIQILISFYLGFGFGDWRYSLPKIKALRKRIFTKANKPKREVIQDYCYILEQNGRVLVRLTKYGYKYMYYREVLQSSWDLSAVKKFKTEKEAQRYLKQVVAKRGVSWEVKKIEKAASFRVAV